MCAGTVSAKPIVLRAEYAYCPNLTIIDTPGFILKVRVCPLQKLTQTHCFAALPTEEYRHCVVRSGHRILRETC